METWQEALPARGGPHPWGPPRTALFTALVEGVRDRVQLAAVSRPQEGAVEDENSLIREALFAGLEQVRTSRDVTLFACFVSYMTVRKLADNRVMLRLRAAQGRCVDRRWSKSYRFGRRLDECVRGITDMLTAEAVTGAAPRGPIERQLLRWLEGRTEAQ